MAAYVIGEQDVIDPEGFNEYQKLVGPIIKHFGGKVLVAGGPIETLEGDWHPKRLVILEFESVEQAKRWYYSDEYAPVRDIRLKTTHSEGILVQGIQ